MKKLMTILLIFLMLISPIYGKTTNSLLENLNLLEEELLISRIHSRNLSKKIIGLKTSLAEAQKLPEKQKQRIKLLQNQLADLSKLLEKSEQTIKDNEDKYEEAVDEIRVAHTQEVIQAKVKGWYKLGVGLVIGGIIGGIAVIILK